MLGNFSRWARFPVRSSRCRSRSARPVLEAMEDRVVPVTNSWLGGNADWAANPATNWSQGHTPLAGEDVLIGNGATVTHSANSDTVLSLMVNGGSTLTLLGGQITDTTDLGVAVGSLFRFQGGTLAGAHVLTGTTITGTNFGGTLAGG
jgi:hypothetical protein